MNISVVTDNVIIYSKFREVIDRKSDELKVKYYCSPSSYNLFENFSEVEKLDVKYDYRKLIDYSDLVISCHCKKIFPPELVNSVRCINIHPGLNPYNRGWYPQVFSINNKFPHGATIHIMDEEIDHGEIIAQGIVSISEIDTSLSVYERVLEKEVELFENYFSEIISGKYKSSPMNSEGNYNSIEDFKNLCNINMDKVGTFREFYDLLRSLTHPPYSNAYFYDVDGNKVYISINISRNPK